MLLKEAKFAKDPTFHPCALKSLSTGRLRWVEPSRRFHLDSTQVPVNDSASGPKQTENRGGTKVGLGWNLWKGSTSLNPFIYRHLSPLGWNVEPFHDFCRQQSISLVARLLITRASRAYFSRPTRLLLKADENTPHDLREYFSYFTIKGKRNYPEIIINE